DIFGSESDQQKLDSLRAKAEQDLALMQRLQAELEKRDESVAAREKKLTGNLIADNPVASSDDDNTRKLLEGQRMMDELNKRFVQDSHYYYLAIAADADRERERFKLALEDKKISERQFATAMELIEADMAAKIKAEQDKLAGNIKTAMQGVSGEIEKIFQS